MRLLKKFGVVIGAMVALSLSGWIIGRKLVEITSPLPNNLGVKDGKLAPCPAPQSGDGGARGRRLMGIGIDVETSNCVSTQASDPAHRIEPVPYTGTLEEARLRLLKIIDVLPNTQLSSVSGPYLHAESRSRFWGFIDDTELYLDDEAKLLHIRTAARLGRGDFNVNRNRALEIRDRFLALSLHDRFAKNKTLG